MQTQWEFNMKIFCVLIIFVLSSVTFSKTNCSEIISDLKQMKTAQASVHASLVSNHEMMAQSLESYSEALTSSAGRAHKAISENMKTAAKSLRERGLKAQNISKKLETNTDEIIKSVEKCLK